MPLDQLELLIGPNNQSGEGNLSASGYADPELPLVWRKTDRGPYCFNCRFCEATPDEAFCDHDEARRIDPKNRRSIAFMRNEAGPCGRPALLYKGL